MVQENGNKFLMKYNYSLVDEWFFILGNLGNVRHTPSRI